MYRVALAACALLSSSTAAFAEPVAASASATAPSAAPTSSASTPERHHAIYVDLLGKGGLWGVGYDYRTHRLALGATVSYYSYDGDRITTIAPYLAAYPLSRGHHSAFVQAGPELVRRFTPSPVPEWMGLAQTHWNAEASVGYEYRARLLVRAYVMVQKGDHVVPWLGASLGWSL
jgi:hypothetical protein